MQPFESQPLDEAESLLPWFALRVKPNCELKSVASLAARGFETFLPMRQAESPRPKQRVSERPLFPGYVFSRFFPRTLAPILGATGVMHILSIDGRPHPLDQSEITALRLLALHRYPMVSWPTFEAGQHVEILEGPLAGVRGVVIREASKSRLIVSITLLRRSVMTELSHLSVRAL